MAAIKRDSGKKKGLNDPLKICLLTYRGNPTCGGQGVYINYLSHALGELGHDVTVISGPPYPELTNGIPVRKLQSLDLYNADHLFKVKNPMSLVSPINQLEFLRVCLGGFPEPLTFGLRTFRHFRRNPPDYDIVHDNQSLSFGVLGISGILGFPTVATIHHPITMDRKTELLATKNPFKKLKILNWYSFWRMQGSVSRRLHRIITVSECSKRDIHRAFRIPGRRIRVIPNGINTDYFYPLPDVKRSKNHILVTSSADTPLKGLRYLIEAVASIRKERDIHLTVIGALKKASVIHDLINQLGVHDCVTFTGRIEYEDFAHYYAKATMAVIPSLYEGFGMPAGEAMACGVPVISTTGGALPEVVGDAGILLPPADKDALAKAICDLLDDPDKCNRLGQAGLKRVNNSFTWRHAAEKTLEVYRETIDAYRRFPKT